jgi:hypothetical protein
MEGIVVFLIYLFTALLVACFFYIKIHKAENRFIEFFVTSLLATALLPLFLGSFGNNLLGTYLGEGTETYTLIELLSYTVVVALAGGKLIEKILNSFDIEVDELRQEHKEILQTQNQFARGVINRNTASSSISQDDICIMLNKLNEADKFVTADEISTGITKCNETLTSLEEAALVLTSKNRHRNKTYRISKLGKQYLKDNS